MDAAVATAGAGGVRGERSVRVRATTAACRCRLRARCECCTRWRSRPGIAPGREHEGGRGRRLRGEERVPIEDDEAAIEELAKFHATAGVGAAAGPGRDLEPTGAQPHVPPIMPRSAWRPGDIGFLTSHAANRTKTAQRGMVPLIPGSPRRARCAPTLGSQWRRTLLPRWRRTCAVLPPAVVYSRPITSHSPVSSARRSPI